MSELFLIHQTGLGEYFLCNGLVNYLSLFYEKLYLPSPISHLPTVKCLYSENSKIEILPYEKVEIDHFFECLSIPQIIVDFWNNKPDNLAWYKYYYTQFGIPYDYRYTYFRLPNIINSDHIFSIVVPENKKYRVVHDGHSGVSRYPLDLTSWRTTDYNDNLETIYLDPKVSDNLLDWIKIFQNADEIHVTPSSAFCLIDSIRSIVTSNLFFHDMRATNAPILHDDLQKNNWQIINYVNKL